MGNGWRRFYNTGGRALYKMGRGGKYFYIFNKGNQFILNHSVFDDIFVQLMN